MVLGGELLAYSRRIPVQVMMTRIQLGGQNRESESGKSRTATGLRTSAEDN